MKKLTIICVPLILIIIFIIGFGYMILNPSHLVPDNPKGKTMYYTKIDNSNVTIGSNNRYDYKLDCYTSDGSKKLLNFSTSKQLKDDAYIELYVAFLRGVTYWHEVQYNQLPKAVQNKWNSIS